MTTKAGLDHLRKRIDDITSAKELRRWWQEDIGLQYQRHPEIIAAKDAAKKRLGE